jgi:hypothetical protein
VSAYRAIDLIVFPFTPATKRDPYALVPDLKESMIHAGCWDREFTAAELVREMDAAGVEKALVCAQQAGVWQVSYEYVRDFVGAFPDRLLATAGYLVPALRGLMAPFMERRGKEAKAAFMKRNAGRA